MQLMVLVLLTLRIQTNMSYSSGITRELKQSNSLTDGREQTETSSLPAERETIADILYT